MKLTGYRGDLAATETQKMTNGKVDKDAEAYKCMMDKPKYDAGQKATNRSEGPRSSDMGTGHFTGK